MKEKNWWVLVSFVLGVLYAGLGIYLEKNISGITPPQWALYGLIFGVVFGLILAKIKYQKIGEGNIMKDSTREATQEFFIMSVILKHADETLTPDNIERIAEEIAT